MVVIDSIVRLIPGVLGNEDSPVLDSFSSGLLEHPHYTRPADFRGMKVPDVSCPETIVKSKNGEKRNRCKTYKEQDAQTC